MRPNKYLVQIVFLLCGFMTFSNFLLAQSNWLKRADALYEKGAWQDALEYYEWATRKKPDANAFMKMGDCYKNLRNLSEAANYYHEAVLEEVGDSIIFFRYAQTLIAMERFKEAELELNKYRAFNPKDKRVENMLESIRERYVSDTDSSQFEISVAPFNSSSDDFAPAFYKEGIIFVSGRTPQAGVVRISMADKKDLLDIYYLEKIPDIDEAKPKKKVSPSKLKGDVNTYYHEGPVCTSADGTELYFTRNNFQNRKAITSKDNVNKLNIYHAELVNDEWKNVTSLPFNNQEYATGHPALTQEGNWLVFVSDMPGGYGGADLYAVSVDSGAYGEPINLGPEVNTMGDELFPYFHSDNTLYFSSDGHGGAGGLDIFYASFGTGTATGLRHFETSLNSPLDDFGIIMNEDKKSGYLSSNRKNELHDDIFSFNIKRPSFDCTEQTENKFCYTFFEASGSNKPGNVIKNYQWDLGDGTVVQSPEVYHCYEKPGTYLVSLNVTDSVSGKVVSTELSDFVEVKEAVQPYIRNPEIGRTQTAITFDALRSNLKEMQVNEYHWDFGDGSWETGESVEHTYLKPGKYKIQLGVIGYDRMLDRESKQCVTSTIEIIKKKDPLGQVECVPQERNTYCFSFDKEHQLEQNDLPLAFEWSFGDDTKERKVKTTHCYPGPGLYQARLNVIDTVRNKIFFNQAILNVRLRDKVQPYIRGDGYVEKGDYLVLDAEKSGVENCILKNYSWDFGDGTTDSKMKTGHEYKVPGDYEISLKVSGNRPTNNQPCAECVTRKIKVMGRVDFALEFPTGTPTGVLQLDEINSLPIGLLRDINEVARVEYDIVSYESPTYSVQIMVSQTPIPLESDFFKGLKDVVERQHDDDFVYTKGEAMTPIELYPTYSEVQDLGFEATMVVAMDDGRVISGNDSTYFVKLPGTKSIIPMSVVQGVLKDVDGIPVKNAPIVWEDLTEGRIYATTETDKNGKYFIELPNGKLYGFYAEVPGFFSVSDNIDLTASGDGVKYIGNLEVFKLDKAPDMPIRLNNIFFDAGSHTLKKESYREIDRLVRLMIESEGVNIEVMGHTDAVGDEASNMELSHRRANAVLRYMVMHGISIEKATAKGYGESMPVASNTTPDGRARNRRVEFRLSND